MRCAARLGAAKRGKDPSKDKAMKRDKMLAVRMTSEELAGTHALAKARKQDASDMIRAMLSEERQRIADADYRERQEWCS